MTVLACDLGGTRMKIGVVRHGTVLARAVEPAHSGKGLRPRLPVLKETWLRLLAGLGLSVEECAGVSVSFPSLIDPGTSRVLAEYGKYADAPGLDLRAWAHEELRLPLAIENDARMALVGEWQAGAGHGWNDLAMITLGTGLGTAAIMEGRLLRGRHGQAGVLGGHISVRYGGRLCKCGNTGCAEAEASTAYLDQIAAGGDERDSATGHGHLSYREIFETAASGDPRAVALRDHSLLVWGTLAVNLIHAYDPEVLILGGGIMASGDVILPAIGDYVARHAHTPWGKVKVVASELGDDAALVAAEWLIREQGIDRVCTE